LLQPQNVEASSAMQAVPPPAEQGVQDLHEPPFDPQAALLVPSMH
jgi:hypothetical protein